MRGREILSKIQNKLHSSWLNSLSACRKLLADIKMKSLPEESYFSMRCWWLCIDIHIQKGLQAMGYYDFMPIMSVGSITQNCIISLLWRELMGWGTTLMINAARTKNNPMIHNTAAKPDKFVCLKESSSQSFQNWVTGYHYWENSGYIFLWLNWKSEHLFRLVCL